MRFSNTTVFLRFKEFSSTFKGPLAYRCGWWIQLLIHFIK